MQSKDTIKQLLAQVKLQELRAEAKIAKNTAILEALKSFTELAQICRGRREDGNARQIAELRILFDAIL